MITAIVSMMVLGVMPNAVTICAIGLASLAAALLAIEPEEKAVGRVPESMPGEPS